MIEEQLLQAAKELILRRYPSGWGGAAAVRIADGRILTSVAPEVNIDALNLCMEVGALLEANKHSQAVTHCLCIFRENENSEFKILSPCGICRERLRYWGENVKVAVTTPSNGLVFQSLKTLMTFDWLPAYE